MSDQAWDNNIGNGEQDGNDIGLGLFGGPKEPVLPIPIRQMQS